MIELDRLEMGDRGDRLKSCQLHSHRRCAAPSQRKAPIRLAIHKRHLTQHFRGNTIYTITDSVARPNRSMHQSDEVDTTCQSTFVARQCPSLRQCESLAMEFFKAHLHIPYQNTLGILGIDSHGDDTCYWAVRVTATVLSVKRSSSAWSCLPCMRCI